MNNIVELYKAAWESHNIELLKLIFHENIIYNDRDINLYVGIDELINYWIKNSKKQKNINFNPIEVTSCDDKIIILWETSFFHTIKKKKKFLKGIIIMTVLDNKIIHFVEYFERKYI
jgi:hypothetical protein